MADWSFYDRGFSLFPLKPNSKAPAVDWLPFISARPAPSLIGAWLPYANMGVATGAVSGVIVLDCDSLLARIEAESRGMPDTLVVSTPRGTHFYLQHPGWPISNHAGRRWTKASDDDEGVAGWDLRADGGFVVGPGSYYVPTPEEAAKGKVEGAYRIERDAPIAPAPDWLLALLIPKPRKPPVPARIADETSVYGRKALNAEITLLLATSPGDGHCNDQINASAFAIAQLVAGGEITSEEGMGALWEALETIGAANDGKSPGTLERGWEAGLLVPRGVDHSEPVPPPEVALGLRYRAAPPPPPPEDGPIPVFLNGAPVARDLTLTADDHADKNSHLTIEFWLSACGYPVAYDEFSDRIVMAGQPLTDQAERAAWLSIRERSRVKFPKELFGDTLRNIAWTNRFHPLRDWLGRVEPIWDGTSRIDGWLHRYLGVPDSAYSRAIGAIFLTAAVRRARRPGSKFDELLVLEGPQGIEKSSAVAALCPVREWFSEDFTVSMDSKHLLEATHGKWLVEAPELSKLNNSEVEHVKHLLSRQVDRARMAYDRIATERGRQWVGFATVNTEQYLSDPTGNRRFWPVRCGAIDVEAICADREQLWAEAACREAAGGATRLPRELWGDAAVEQAERVVVDPFLEVLTQAIGTIENGRIPTDDIWSLLGVPIDRRNSVGRKLGDAMRHLGWTRRAAKKDGKFGYAYFKGTEIPEIFFDVTTRKLSAERPKLAVV